MRRLSPARLLVSLIASGIAARAGAQPSFAGEALRWDLRAELGGEYDSNVHRSEIVRGAGSSPAAAPMAPAIVGSPLARAAISGHLSDAVGRGQRLMLSATLAGKLFTAAAARDEDVAIADSGGRWQLALGADTAIGAQALYYEAFQRTSGDAGPGENAGENRRDFRSLTPTVHFDRRLTGNTVLVAAAGYRWFVFKPNLDFDFTAPVGALDLRWSREPIDDGAASADWELTAGASAERRAFEGRAISSNPTTPPPAPPLRRDTFLVGHLELTRVGAVLIGAGYALHWNDSNSYGESLTRHLATLRFATALPFDSYLAARAELILAQYRDPVAIAQGAMPGTLLSIEDENRSSLRVDLSRALADRVLLLARYTLYANELGVSSPVARYRRQTAMLSLAFTLEK